MVIVLLNLKTVTGYRLFECDFTLHIRLKSFQNHYFKRATVLPHASHQQPRKPSTPGHRFSPLASLLAPGGPGKHPCHANAKLIFEHEEHE